MQKKSKTKEVRSNLVTKKIKNKEVVFLIGRGENCSCYDCPVLYGDECPTSLPATKTKSAK